MSIIMASTIAAGFLTAMCAGFAAQADIGIEDPRPNKSAPPIVGMYVHQHWSYNHPYAARTWTLEDWQGYLDGICRIGYNTVLIWPVLETMPEPLTPSDEESLAKLEKVIAFAHQNLNMRVYIALCPNVEAKNEEAAKYTFEKRPFFYCDRRINPADSVAMEKMIAHRKKMLTPLRKADGVFIIDSDPGGYPGSTNAEFVNLLVAHRQMLDSLNPGREIFYWIHVGWEAYCRFYQTAEFEMGKKEEIFETISMLAKANPEPWGLACGKGPRFADEIGMASRVLSYQYGAIEGEPSFPFTNFHSPNAYRVGKELGARGTFGNSQTHCLQLPNAFLFACGAHQKPSPTNQDYIDFADRLIPGHGKPIVSAWEALNLYDADKIRAALSGLKPLLEMDLKPGELKGLLLNDAHRFILDLALMLETLASLETFHEAAMIEPEDQETGGKMMAFVDAISAWQAQHGYQNMMFWPRLDEALLKIDKGFYESFFAARDYRGEGATPFEQIQNGYMKVESFTPRLIEAMRNSARKLAQSGN